MRVILQEYGRCLLAVLTGSFAIAFCLAGFKKTVPAGFLNGTSELTVSREYQTEPVIVAPRVIRIDVGDMRYDAATYASDTESEEYKKICKRYCDMVQCYENSSKDELCRYVTVRYAEQVQIDQPGRYYVSYTAENAEGNIFTKDVQVIVR